MIISSLTDIAAVPTPALGLLPALHDAEVEDTVFTEGGEATLPTPQAAKGRVFRNQGDKPIILPSAGKWPARNLAPGELYGSDGRLFYRVVNKAGTTSYYPQHFERNVYTFSFSSKTFPLGEVFEFERFFYFRLIANNTTAVWSVIFEIGERIEQPQPAFVLEIPAVLTSGQKTIQISDPRLGSLVYNMVVTGDGIPGSPPPPNHIFFADNEASPPPGMFSSGPLDGTTYIAGIHLASGTVTLTKAATQSGTKTLTFTAPVGPNLNDWRWLPPLLEEQIVLTDMKSMNPLGIWIKNWGEKTKTFPDGSVVADPYRNDFGFEGYAKLFNQSYPVRHESLPSSSEFLLRLRIGQFDTENDVADPRGYAAYVIRSNQEDDPGADTA